MRRLTALLWLFLAASSAAAMAQAIHPAVQEALLLIGTGIPYQWGGTTLQGMDCSAFVQRSYRAAGVALPRTSREQFSRGVPVSRADLRPGDLLFWAEQGRINHVGLYVGLGGVAHSSAFSGKANIEPIAAVGRRAHFAGARRITRPVPPVEESSSYLTQGIENLRLRARILLALFVYQLQSLLGGDIDH